MRKKKCVFEEDFDQREGVKNGVTMEEGVEEETLQTEMDEKIQMTWVEEVTSCFQEMESVTSKQHERM